MTQGDRVPLADVLRDEVERLGAVARDWRPELAVDELGEVASVGSGIATVHGLPRVRADEVVRFAGGEEGVALDLQRDHVGVVLLTSDAGVGAGTEVTRTGRVLDVPVGDALLGRVVDPLGGSYYVEKLTNDIVEKSRAIIDEVEQMGGMAKAISAGMPKMRIEEAAARRQARIEQGREVVVGVNKYQVEDEVPIAVREISEAVRDSQVDWINEIKTKRDEAEVKRALEAVTNCAASDGNLLEACIPAVRARATVGEISDAMEAVFGRFTATTQCISGVYAGEYQDDEIISAIRKRCEQFLEKTGRRPRILLSKMGQDGHDRGVKVVATAYADLGFDVDLSPMFQTPEEAAKMAIENDVHILGVSSLAGAHKILVPKLVAALKQAGGEEIAVVVGGIIPPGDYDFLYNAGVVSVFGPGTMITDSANQLLNILEKNG